LFTIFDLRIYHLFDFSVNANRDPCRRHVRKSY